MKYIKQSLRITNTYMYTISSCLFHDPVKGYFSSFAHATCALSVILIELGSVCGQTIDEIKEVIISIKIHKMKTFVNRTTTFNG